MSLSLEEGYWVSVDQLDVFRIKDGFLWQITSDSDRQLHWEKVAAVHRFPHRSDWQRVGTLELIEYLHEWSACLKYDFLEDWCVIL